MTAVDQPSAAATPDDRAGLVWWNALRERDRRKWMRRAGDTGRAVDAWRAFKAWRDARR